MARMVTRRAARSTVWPARAYSYSGLPSFFSAECIGGTWSISPTKRPMAVRNCSGVTATGRSLSTSPSASAVLVRMPRRTTVSYVLSASSRSCENLVASPKHNGSRPVASGSSVPVCPAFLAHSRRLTRISASLLDQPIGLSSSSTPCTSRRGCFACWGGRCSVIVSRLWRARRWPDRSAATSRCRARPNRRSGNAAWARYGCAGA